MFSNVGLFPWEFISVGAYFRGGLFPIKIEVGFFRGFFPQPFEGLFVLTNFPAFRLKSHNLIIKQSNACRWLTGYTLLLIKYNMWHLLSYFVTILASVVCLYIAHFLRPRCWDYYSCRWKYFPDNQHWITRLLPAHKTLKYGSTLPKKCRVKPQLNPKKSYENVS